MVGGSGFQVTGQGLRSQVRVRNQESPGRGPAGPKTPATCRHRGVWGIFIIIRDQYWSREKRVPVPGPSWALPTPMLWEAGERPGSACAIEV